MIKMSLRTWILGASDPEMALIERHLNEAGEEVLYAAVHGRRVAAHEAYRATGLILPTGEPVLHPRDGMVYLVECSVPVLDGSECDTAAIVRRIDHHRPGDPGYGRGPEEFLPASSIGQVLNALDPLGPMEVRGGVWVFGAGAKLVPAEVVWTAAGDHCPAAAYRGQCPGVDPDSLMEFRVRVAAAFQKRSVEAVMAEVNAAIAAIEAAPKIVLGGAEVADLRSRGAIPSLPEASLRTGVPIIYQISNPTGPKVGILGAGEGSLAGPAPVVGFMQTWGPAQGLSGIYGDPARGYAGGYVL